jgi:hypothetical protein
MWWLSTRVIRHADDPEWESYINSLGLSHLREVRTIDSWCNPHVADSGNFSSPSLEQVWEMLDWLPTPIPSKQYYLLFTSVLNVKVSIEHHRLKLLGYDLSDETWTSSLLNCGRWEGVLEPIAQKVNEYGLLNLEDAKTAQTILPLAWNGDRHAFVTIWALFEVTLSGHDCC